VLAGALAIGLVAAPAQAALRHLDGTVVSKHSDNRSFDFGGDDHGGGGGGADDGLNHT
jgi:hypothetical protein